jgi:hypothetical protein
MATTNRWNNDGDDGGEFNDPPSIGRDEPVDNEAEMPWWWDYEPVHLDTLVINMNDQVKAALKHVHQLRMERRVLIDRSRDQRRERNRKLAALMGESNDE